MNRLPMNLLQTPGLSVCLSVGDGSPCNCRLARLHSNWTVLTRPTARSTAALPFSTTVKDSIGFIKRDAGVYCMLRTAVVVAKESWLAVM
ncbi:hypothetical protein MPTK1_2g17900 [Marchantia polymorpha subsp. ruderalis]|uniref:Uncharacterized protein n=1 Tax=Marchantia polymorpha TaxID=3197 RepID=A0A2R6WGB1_MARPO|nr:hypothetical protein MARPO_0094s0059 [Marchantia polymorpha]BBN02763.1 hypothetical protein Mp_2g17900 [Marchantia polymorpha subsp. ruderalis]|eukprot:PTQ32890.1 hypothetical protein MARPO_0094s0059 [Marchantia polymorpha]